MILVERSACVRAPIEAVWEVVQRVEQLPAWLAGVQEAEVLSGEGYGRRQRVQVRRGAAVEAEVIAYQAPTLIGWRERAKGAGARAEARTEVYVQLAVEGDATAVRLIVVRWPSSPLGRALVRLGVRRAGSALEGSLARLTELTSSVNDRPADEQTPAPDDARLADLLQPTTPSADADGTPQSEARVAARGVATAGLKC
jgi:uncharacterized protein YndB with AHSA1/START domain